MRYIKHTLRNGLRVILAPMADVESVTVMIMTGVGSRYEDVHENGLAHFLEHMFFKGTKKRPTAQAISNELDAVGGEYNAFTGKDRTAYYAKVNAAHIDTALDVVSDLFLHARIAQRDVEKERGAIIQEISMYEDAPSRDVYHVFERLLYGATHPLGRDVLGTKENILSFTRKDLLAYHKRCYTSHNTAVCIAGKFSKQKVLAKIRADFASMHTGAAPTYMPFDAVQKASRIAIKQKETDQTHFIIGVPAYGIHHKDRAVVNVLMALLGSGMSSRLFVEIREKRGLAYSIHAGVESYAETGAFYVKAGVEHKNITKVITLILRELAKVTRRVVSEKELHKAKEYLKGHIVLGLETSDDIAHYLVSHEVVRGAVKLPHVVMREIDAVTADDVKRVALDLFTTETLNLAVIGPHKGREKELQSLLNVQY